jgi:hypothetical protein
MELLRDALLGDEISKRLWLQYAVNLKGERQLFWSPGLRALLGLVVEQTDEEIAAELEGSAVLFAQIDSGVWQVLLANDSRAEVLGFAARGDYIGFVAFVSSLHGLPSGLVGLDVEGVSSGKQEVC